MFEFGRFSINVKMDSFPLNAVENTCEERKQDKKVHPNYGEYLNLSEHSVRQILKTIH